MRVYLSLGALYPGSERGLVADLLTAQALEVVLRPICTALVMASAGIVTDVTDVPEDTVRAQLEHLSATESIAAVKLGVLAGHGTAALAFDYCEKLGVPSLLDLQLSGPSGETVLTQRGIETVRQRLSVPDLVVAGRSDAALLSGGEIESLDDAQVAAQRIVRQGARAVVIKCGPLPARFFEVEGAERPDAVFNADLYYDGTDFALYEAPHLEEVTSEGTASAFSLPILDQLARGASVPEAIQHGKQFITEALRATKALGPEARLRYFWRNPAVQA